MDRPGYLLRFYVYLSSSISLTSHKQQRASVGKRPLPWPASFAQIIIFCLGLHRASLESGAFDAHRRLLRAGAALDGCGASWSLVEAEHGLALQNVLPEQASRAFLARPPPPQRPEFWPVRQAQTQKTPITGLHSRANGLILSFSTSTTSQIRIRKDLAH